MLWYTMGLIFFCELLQLKLEKCLGPCLVSLFFSLSFSLFLSFFLTSCSLDCVSKSWVQKKLNPLMRFKISQQHYRFSNSRNNWFVAKVINHSIYFNREWLSWYGWSFYVILRLIRRFNFKVCFISFRTPIFFRTALQSCSTKDQFEFATVLLYSVFQNIFL